MKRVGLFLSLLVLIGWVGVSAAKTPHKILLKEKMAADTYCHARFPAIRPSTLDNKHPVLKNSATGDTIDFYGSCDENPVGKDQVISQRLQDERWRRQS
jgi:hypothetical protein